MTDPNTPMYADGNVYQRELKYLKDKGYTWTEKTGYWLVVPRR